LRTASRARPDTRSILLLLVLLPFWISFLLRVYAWMGILSTLGVLNGALLSTGLIERPPEMLYSDTAVFLGMVYSYLPFMILPLYAVLKRLDPALLEAASDLGGRPRRVFLDVTLPLSLPGVVAGCLLVFIPAMGEFVIPALLGGADTLMIGRVVYDEFFLNRDWPVAATVAVLLIAILVGPILLFQRTESQGGEGTLVVFYSFNDSRLVSVWGGFSLLWYAELFRSGDVLEAALFSLRIAAVSATLATVLGTLAGLSLARMGRFRGRLLFAA
jgi:ABC-type spermidine/putrescine transport system permease subunit I